MLDVVKRKHVTAAIAAVTAYLQFEQEAGAMGVVEEPTAVPVAPVRLWGMSGRQAQMQARTLMQMRAFK